MNFSLKNLFLNNWERKCISVMLSTVIWLAVNHGLTTTKVLENVAIHIVNLPEGMTVQGLQPNGLLTKKIALTVHGNRSELDEVSSNDIEIVLDAKDKTGDWLATISRKTLVSLNPDVDLPKSIQKIQIQRLPLSLTPLIIEKIPVIVTRPIGTPPSGYQFIDIWPYRFTMTVKGPEPVIQQLKQSGVKLSLNLNEILHKDLPCLDNKENEISYLIPDRYKIIDIPTLSNYPFKIDDPLASKLRIDLIREEFYPLVKKLPITIFYPTQAGPESPLERYTIALNEQISQTYGAYRLQKPLYVKGVSQSFLDVIKDKIQLSITIPTESEKTRLKWNIQFLNPRQLEERYIALVMSKNQQANSIESLKEQEEYLRNRFRIYMNQFQLYTEDEQKFDVMVELKNQEIVLYERNHH